MDDAVSPRGSCRFGGVKLKGKFRPPGGPDALATSDLQKASPAVLPVRVHIRTAPRPNALQRAAEDREPSCRSERRSVGVQGSCTPPTGAAALPPIAGGILTACLDIDVTASSSAGGPLDFRITSGECSRRYGPTAVACRTSTPPQARASVDPPLLCGFRSSVLVRVCPVKNLLTYLL